MPSTFALTRYGGRVQLAQAAATPGFGKLELPPLPLPTFAKATVDKPFDTFAKATVDKPILMTDLSTVARKREGGLRIPPPPV